MPRGVGSTSTRRLLIEGIYQRWVPIPEARGDQLVLDFIKEVEELVAAALDDFRQQVEAEARLTVDTMSAVERQV